MRFITMVKKIQRISGLSGDESKDALEMMVESLAVHLPERDRRKFAAELPTELSDLALSVMATRENSTADMVHQFMEVEHISEVRAMTHIISAWKVLKSVLSLSQIRRIRMQLPKTTLPLLR